MNLRALIREMPGKGRCDLSKLLGNAEAFHKVAADLAAPFLRFSITHVVGIDASGLGLAGAVAIMLRAGFVPLRKGGKGAWETRSISFTDYSGEVKWLELVADALDSTARVLIVDDWSETGAQLAAAANLCASVGATVVGASVINADKSVHENRPMGIPLLHCAIEY